MTLNSDVKFEEKLICYFKNDKNLANFDLRTQKVSKICKVFDFWPKKVQTSYLS